MHPLHKTMNQGARTDSAFLLEIREVTGPGEREQHSSSDQPPKGEHGVDPDRVISHKKQACEPMLTAL